MNERFIDTLSSLSTRIRLIFVRFETTENCLNNGYDIGLSLFCIQLVHKTTELCQLILCNIGQCNKALFTEEAYLGRWNIK